MAWNNSDETVVGGTGQVYVADVGTALPAGPETALDGSFNGLGLHTEDGVSVNRSQELFRLKAWQPRADVRRERESEAFQITFALLQWNEVNVPLAFGGGEVTSVSGGYRFDPASIGDPVDERALVCDVEDGDEVLRFVVPRGTVVEGVDSQFAKSQGSALSITFEALEPVDGSLAWHFLTNSDAFVAGS